MAFIRNELVIIKNQFAAMQTTSMKLIGISKSDHREQVTAMDKEDFTRAYVSRSYVREGFPIFSLSWWGWGSCYESVVLGAPFTPAGSTAEAERRVAHSISCDITL